jgi:translocation and assembly module TamB
MAHRSNQAVASQDQAAPQEPQDDPPPRRRFLIGWATALAALGVSSVLIGGGIWLARFSIAELLIGAALAERGADADFDVVALDLNHAVLNGVRFGAETAPDAAIAVVEARWGWRGLVPELRAVRLIEPRLRLRLDGAGRVSAGALDHIQGRPSARRTSIPVIRLDIVDGQALIEAPFGALEASFRADGVLGQDFTALAVINETNRPGEIYALSAGAAELNIASRDNTLHAQLYANAAALRWNALALDGASVRVAAQAPLDLSTYAVEAVWRADAIQAPRLDARAASGMIGAEATARQDGLDPQTWQAQAGARADRLTLADNTFFAPALDAHADGGDREGRGAWTLTAQRFAGLALTSAAPSAEGTFTLDWRDGAAIEAEARAVLAQSSLDARAQQRIRDAIPNLAQAPVGPTFAAAESALDRAADRFDLALPLRLRSDRTGAQLVLAAPAEARASSGARLRLSPLRQDAPAMRLELPALLLQGAVALELSGGGAPDMSLLLDSVAWAPDAPFEADGTLTLANWRNEGAEISADELGVGIVVQPNGYGAIDLRGPARVTGPLGDGQVRDLVAQLDLTAQWGDGWRVTPARTCLPMRLGGLDAAGLSFANGQFSLCALENTLIAADARGRLGGGFAIQALALQGRMAGPEGQPARLSSRRVTGRFSGVEGDVTLALVADAPTLAVEMGEARTLSVAMARLTADARIAESWRVDGAFEQGGLNDPALPGSVSAIAGRWSAAPEDGKPVIRVIAAEAALEANRPASDAELPLFNPMRLVGVDAVFRDGRINADGAVVLADGERQLAHFTARHIVSEGVGGADISAPDIMFGPDLQPYHVSELARGVVENVRGPASAEAGVVWTRTQLSTAALVRLNGVSLASATIPLIQDVRGEILFDDLFALTTPPGQEVRVGALNPGVAVENGRVRFQLLADGAITIEAAEFEFASGVLSMRPETFTLGEDEQEVLLTLRDVDASALIATLNIPDLEATGRIEGSFPLRLTRRSAIVTDGVLRAAPGGGRIAYTGQAGEQTTGVTRVAFDALRDFRYEVLSLTLNGDLNDEIVSDIEFTGENVGEPIDLSPVASLPGIGRVTMVGVPFRFNVKVTAPFRRLADTAATIIDPASLLNRERTETPEVDPEAQPPR